MGYKSRKNKQKRYSKKKGDKKSKKNKQKKSGKKSNKRTFKREKKGSNLKIFKQLSCSPDKNLDYTCYNSKSIEQIRDSWNKSNPNDKILTNNIKDIWLSLQKNLANVCNNEKCWLKQKFMENNLDNNLLKYTFAPNAPVSWQHNPNEWLDSDNINQVMRQYEHHYPDFKFIGPSPIDFDTIESFGRCVWSDLCNFNIKDYLDKGIYKIGIIFNTDPHYKGGSHWISTFIDFKKKYLFYFDSNADKTPKELITLFHDIKYQALALPKPIVLDIWQNITEHQRSDTECGVYSLYTIIQLLTGKMQITDFDKRIPDSIMEKSRTILFNTK